MSLTVAYITSRHEPKIEWFFDSLSRQAGSEFVDVIVVSPYDLSPEFDTSTFTLAKPKPTIWQGEHRITKEDWWAKSNAHNTAIILCRTEFIAFVDDRCVLGPMWLRAVRAAMDGQYAVCGRYEKRANMKVEGGAIIEQGELLGLDERPDFDGPVPTRDWYGGSCALPLEWCLAVNGYDEKMCDSLGSEDSMFGVTLRNSGFPMKYDARMKIIEDRTPSEIGGALKRADKNPHLGTKAKSWDIVRAFYGKRTSQNDYDIRNMRDRVLAGEDLHSIPPIRYETDWYDGQKISEME